MLGGIGGRRRRGRQRMKWLDGITDSMDMSWSISCCTQREASPLVTPASLAAATDEEGQAEGGGAPLYDTEERSEGEF